jgi:hypothetical protein
MSTNWYMSYIWKGRTKDIGPLDPSLKADQVFCHTLPELNGHLSMFDHKHSSMMFVKQIQYPTVIPIYV